MCEGRAVLHILICALSLVLTLPLCCHCYETQHNVGHHTYTNVFGVDPDQPMKKENDIRRLVPAQLWLPIYKYQHIYMLPLYGVYLLKNRVQDFSTYWYKMSGNIPVNPFEWDIWFQYFMTKSIWISWRILVPVFYFGVPIKEFALLFLYTEWLTGVRNDKLLCMYSNTGLYYPAYCLPVSADLL